MTELEHHVEVMGVRGAGQDRAAVVDLDDARVVVLADGAGGTVRGATGAACIVDGAATLGDPAAALTMLDGKLQQLGAQSTAVIAVIRDGMIEGASVGDSGAWLVDGADIVDLTEHQQRKPLVGAGCLPQPLQATRLGKATLLVASDGLLKYAAPRDVVRVLASEKELPAAARALVALVRLSSGALQDDVAIVLVRRVAGNADQ